MSDVRYDETIFLPIERYERAVERQHIFDEGAEGSCGDVVFLQAVSRFYEEEWRK